MFIKYTVIVLSSIDTDFLPNHLSKFVWKLYVTMISLFLFELHVTSILFVVGVVECFHMRVVFVIC